MGCTFGPWDDVGLRGVPEYYPASHILGGGERCLLGITRPFAFLMLRWMDGWMNVSKAEASRVVTEEDISISRSEYASKTGADCRQCHPDVCDAVRWIFIFSIKDG
jgi:hypothetical protein